MTVSRARSVILSVTSAAILIVGMSGCTSVNGTPSSAPSAASSSPSSSETAVPEEEEPEAFPFVLPTTCPELVGAELEAQLLSEGRVFLFGSNNTGIYAGQYFQGLQEVGTPLSCAYGVDNSGVYIEIDVQGLTPDAYQAALTILKDHEFTESSDGDVKTFALVGAVDIVVAQVHVLLPDSWITIAHERGGTSAFDEMNEWVEMVASQVYPEP